jgi:hypothetical protein
MKSAKIYRMGRKNKGQCLCPTTETLPERLAERFANLMAKRLPYLEKTKVHDPIGARKAAFYDNGALG